ncbi:hypothetical protein HQ520_01150, partial [bacterium]|nr:hypothetical protein [bacterium]
MKKVLLGVLIMMTTLTGWSEETTRPPKLSSPEDGASMVSPFPRFYWEKLPGTLDYRAPIAYDIEIARDKGFEQVVDRDQVNLARYVADEPFEVGDYCWRVRSVSPDGAPGEWGDALALKIKPCDETIRVDLNGSGEALPALRKAFAKAAELSQAGRSVRITVPKGEYSLTPDTPEETECLMLQDASNIILDFGGSYFGVKRWGADFTRLNNCRDVAAMNATVDWDEEIPFTQMIVTGRDLEAARLTLRTEPGFPEYDSPHFARSGGLAIIMDPDVPGRMKGGAPIHVWLQGGHPKKEGDRLWGVWVKEKENTKYFEIGDRVIDFARTRGGQSLCDSIHSQRITYYGITSYSTGGGGHYMSIYDDELAVLHCSELIKEGRWLGGNADGVHAKGHPIGPWVEGLTVNGIADDAIAFYTRPAKIHEAHVDGNPRIFLFYNDFFNLEAGDPVVFFNPRRGVFFAEATVVESVPEGDYQRVTFDRDLPKPEKIGPDPKETDQVWNRGKSCGDFMIRRCRITNVRRFGVVFRALRGVVEDNYIEGTSSSAVASFNEPYWPNGPMSSGILIQNNT